MTALKIAVLDDYQKVSVPYFEQLKTSGKYEVTTFTDTLRPYSHPDTSDDDRNTLVKRLEPYAIICTMRERTPFPGDLISRLPNLKLLLTTGVRNASIDVGACQARGIPVAGASREPASAGPAATSGATRSGPDNTTQHCVTLIMALARNVAQDDSVMKTEEMGWQTGLATSLAGKTLGLLGLGRLGGAVARIMYLGFGMRIVAWSANLTQEAADQRARDMGLPVEDEAGEKTFKAVGKEDMFRSADVVTVQTVLSDRTRGIISTKELAWMKKSAFLVNTSRGPIVDNDALLEVANRGGIGGVAMDVYDVEPLPKESSWRSKNWGRDGSSRVLLTPHMGYVEGSALGQWYQQQVNNIQRWEKGEEMQVVFKDNGY